MKQQLLQKKIPVFTLQVDKSETRFRSAQAVTDHIKKLIDKHEISRFIAEFDHYSHTKGLDGGEIADGIIDARNVVFCFGAQLMETEMLAVRPCSIGIAETTTGFTLSFMHTPIAVVNDTMEIWVKSMVSDVIS